jgi:hypothetical protein
MSTEYDSAADTAKHRYRVRALLSKIRGELWERGRVHDRSKLKEPEKAVFDEWTPKLKGSTYGSDEYAMALSAMGEGLWHHYAHNRHHPEHFEGGITGMTLVDLVEMFCDWKAATERHDDGSLQRSIQQNNDRFGMGPVLTKILENTRRELDW